MTAYTDTMATALEQLQAGRHKEAESVCRQVLDEDPSHAEAIHLLGIISHRIGQHDQAMNYLRQAITHKPKEPSFYSNFGAILQASGKPTLAIELLQEALGLGLELPEIHYNLARALYDECRYEEAIQSYTKALQLKPNYAQAHNNLGMTLKKQNRLAGALECFQKAYQCDHRMAEAYYNAALLYAQQDQSDEAIEHFQHALRLRPRYADAVAGQASIYAKKGQWDRAAESLEPFLEGPNVNVNVALEFAKLAGRRKRQQEAVRLLEQILSARALPHAKRQAAHFCLGKLYDELGAYTQAFAHFQQGNDSSPRTFDPGKHEQAISELIQVFSRENMPLYPQSRSSTDLPIFIVGMPRSGTSLVEQILASHPDVYGAGELKEIHRLVHSLPAMVGSGDGYPGSIKQMSQEVLEHVAREYSNKLAAHAPDAKRITDKLPQNYLHLGLIALAFPKAAVIHCTRDPLDTCLSCYFQNFLSGQVYAFSLRDLGAYYRAYERLMTHWSAVLEIPMLQVRYEELVQNTERVSRTMLEFSGLEWDENCLRFYETKRDVVTGSYDQVRQPIYKTSLGKSKHYEQFLGPLVEALGKDGPGAQLDQTSAHQHQPGADQGQPGAQQDQPSAHQERPSVAKGLLDGLGQIGKIIRGQF